MLDGAPHPGTREAGRCRRRGYAPKRGLMGGRSQPGGQRGAVAPGSCVMFGSPYATLFITVLFLPPLTENLQYQRVIKDQAAADEAEAVSRYISLAIGRHKGLVCTKPG